MSEEGITNANEIEEMIPSENLFTETSHESWFDRIKDSCCGMFIGLILFTCSFPLLIWNEGRSVEQFRTLRDGAKSVISVSIDKIDDANQGKLVHVSGRALPGSSLLDDVFGISPDVNETLKLRREVEMYQWYETVQKRDKKSLGGSKSVTRTYSYDTEWSSESINSNLFRESSGHENPASIPFDEMTEISDPISVGVFELPKNMIESIDWFEPFALPTNFSVENATFNSSANVTIHDDALYFGKDPSKPAVGDTKVFFKIVPSGNVSIVAQQNKGTFSPYPSDAGGTIFMIERGTLSTEEMFQKAMDNERAVVWILRLLGWMIMCAGIVMMLEIVSVLADILPILGDIVSFGTMIIAVVISFFLTVLVVAISWIVFRPLYAALLILFGGGILIFTKWRISKNRAMKKQEEGIE